METLPNFDEDSIASQKKLTLKYLPKYAYFILTHHLEKFTDEVIELSKKEEVSYFKNFESLSDEEYYTLNVESNERLLQKLSERDIEDFIRQSTAAYINNRLPLVDKEDILAEDIIIHSMIIRKAFRHLLGNYTSDSNYFILVMDDVDSFMAAYKVSVFKAYLHIQEEKLKRINEDLLLAQELSHMGSFSWDLLTGKADLTNTAQTILGLSKSDSLSDFFNHVHPDYLDVVKRSLDNAIHNNGRYECEYLYIVGGMVKRIRALGVVTYIDGKPVKMRGSIIDKTREDY